MRLGLTVRRRTGQETRLAPGSRRGLFFDVRLGGREVREKLLRALPAELLPCPEVAAFVF